MTNLRPLFIPLFLLLFTSEGVLAYSRKLTSAIDTLDMTIKQRQDFVDARKARIDSLKNVINKITGDYYGLHEIGVAYRGFNNDSAIQYYDRAYKKASHSQDASLARRALINYAGVLPQSGMFTDALAILDTIKTKDLTRVEKLQFYGLRAKIYLDAIEYPPFYPHRDEYKALAINDLDTLLTLMPAGSIGHRLTAAQLHFINGNEPLAFGELLEVFDQLQSSDELYAVVAGLLAKYFENKSDKKEEYLYYLTVSSISDVKKANGEAASLVKLGIELFEQGDYDHAFDYLSASGQSLAESGSRMMITEVAPPLAVFSDVMRTREAKRKRSDVLWIIINILIFGASVAVGVVFYIKNRKKGKQNRHLADSVSLRESYIERLLEMCWIYVESLEEYNRLIARKIKANQTQDLLKTVESGKMIQDQSEKFFARFDDAIIKMFPDFITELNALLLPDKQMSLTETGRLTPELRIIAFMRLGIVDSNRLAKFLGLSLNTIYTYRNRMKSRAIDRENFDQNIQKIGFSV